MKKITKIITILVVIVILIQDSIVLANVINLGEVKYIERGDEGFYSVQYWHNEDQMWYYIIYSRTYYTDNNGQKRIAYCINPDRTGVGWLNDEYEGYNATIQEKLSNDKLWRVYKNGYPYVTPEQLGVETEDDAYLATKQAAYCILRNQTGQDVYNYYRAGTTTINGEDIEDIQRRGQKVVDAIYNLVEIGNNGTESMNGIKITKVGDLKRQPNYSNYSEQEFWIENNNEDISITINNIKNAPEGTFIIDNAGKKRNSFKGGERFKIVVPRWNINKDYNMSIEYSSTCKNYPVYYAKSSIEGTQDYLLSAEKYEDENGEFNCFIDSRKSKFVITKKDTDTKEPIEGVKFNIKYEDGENLGDFITDENGKIYVENLKPGNIEVTEIEAEEAYIISNSSTVHKIEYDTEYEIIIYNKARRGDLEILKVDKDDNTKVLSDVEFALIDSRGKIIAKERTNSEGKIIFENIKIGDYILRETDTLDEYNLIYDQNVSIKENETISMKIENEKKKGQIKVIKLDKENNKIKIPGVEFEILDREGNLVEKIKTDSDGVAYSSRIPIGEYYIKETKTDSRYILDDKTYTIEVKENETTEIKVENEKKKGKIKIIKTSKNDNKLNGKKAGSPIENVKFEIYTLNGTSMQIVTTDENGIAISEDLPSGKYLIKEIEAGTWYILNNNTYEIELKENEEIVEINIENDSADPKIEIDKEGPDKTSGGKEIRYNFKIENIGNTTIEEMTWYDFLPYEKAKLTKFSTGTFNQDICYKIYYKTNYQSDYILLKENMSSKVNNYIDISEINLDKDEVITEIKIEFGKVDKGFKSEEDPYMYLKTNSNLAENEELINETILDGYYEKYKVSAEDIVNTIIVNEEVKQRRLPRTGF